MTYLNFKYHQPITVAEHKLSNLKKENTMNTSIATTTETATQEKQFVLSKERHFEIVKTFKEFAKNKENHPYKDQTYGNKIDGKLSFIHYVLYAIIRQKNPDLTSHDPKNSEKYAEIMSSLDQAMHNIKRDGNLSRYSYYNRIASDFGITPEELYAVLNKHFN